MEGFRISFGDASCRLKNYSVEEEVVCKNILSRIEKFKLLTYQQVNANATEETDVISAGNKKVKIISYMERLEDDMLLIVIQAFYPTLWKPNFISFSGTGRIFAEGLIFHPNGTIAEASQEVLWHYR
jgi:hypothetical protein